MKNKFVCDKSLTFQECELAILRNAVDLAENKIQKLDEELIPSFIVEEALYYYCELERYELCQKIKTFFSNNTKYTVESSRSEWYGIDLMKKQSH